MLHPWVLGIPLSTDSNRMHRGNSALEKAAVEDKVPGREGKGK